MTAPDEAGVFVQLCSRHGIPEAVIAEIRARGLAITESARQPMPPPGPAMIEQSRRRHQQCVTAYQRAQEDALGAVPDLPAFTGVLERAVRAGGSGGSVSSTLFVGETLEGVSIEGGRAWATRRMENSATEDVGFVRRKKAWHIKLFARRP